MKFQSVFFALALATFASGAESAAEWNKSGVGFYSQTRYREAEAAFRKAVEKWETKGPAAALDLARARGNLGSALRAQGRFSEADPLLVDSLRELEALSGPESVDAGRALHYLGALYRERGDPVNAELVLLRAGHIFEERLEADASLRIQNQLLLAAAYVDQGRFAEAEAILKSAAGAGGGVSAVLAYNGLAAAALGRHDAPAAETYARQALDLARFALPAGTNPITAAALNNLAQSYRFQHRYLEAERAYRQAIEIWESVYGTAHPNVARGLVNLAGMYHDMGYETTSERLYRRAIAILDRALGGDNPAALTARHELAAVVRAERKTTAPSRASGWDLEKTFAPAGPPAVPVMEAPARTN